MDKLHSGRRPKSTARRCICLIWMPSRRAPQRVRAAFGLLMSSVLLHEGQSLRAARPAGRVPLGGGLLPRRADDLQKARHPPERILYSGVNKGADDVARAVALGRICSRPRARCTASSAPPRPRGKALCCRADRRQPVRHGSRRTGRARGAARGVPERDDRRHPSLLFRHAKSARTA